MGTLTPQLYFERHVVKRGQYKNTAPVGPRWKKHFHLYRQNGGQWAVRYYRTDIVVIHNDGSITIDAGGYENSPTTREAIDLAVGRFTSFRVHIRAHCAPRLAYPHPVLHVRFCAKPTSVLFFNGVHISADGVITKPASGWPMVRKVAVDRDARKEWCNQPHVKTFKSILPVLHSSIEVNHGATELHDLRRPEYLLDDEAYWGAVVDHFWRTTWQETWKAIYAYATEGMITTFDVPF